MSVTPSQLAEMPEVVRLLKTFFDLELGHPDSFPQPYFTIQGDEHYVQFGVEGSGGSFLLGSRNGHVLYVSSEGSAGIVSPSLTRFLAILIAFPYWQDILKFSHGGKLKEMRKAAELLEPELQEDEPDIDAARSELARNLELDTSLDYVDLLHRAVSDKHWRVVVMSMEGGMYDPLVGRFATSDNPAWRARGLAARSS